MPWEIARWWSAMGRRPLGRSGWSVRQRRALGRRPRRRRWLRRMGLGRPDFEDFIRKGQDRFKTHDARRWPAEGIGSKGIIVAPRGQSLWGAHRAFTGCSPNEQGVVLLFGKWVRTALSQPGLHWHPPYPDRNRGHALTGRAAADSDRRRLSLRRRQNAASSSQVRHRKRA